MEPNLWDKQARYSRHVHINKLILSRRGDMIHLSYPGIPVSPHSHIFTFCSLRYVAFVQYLPCEVRQWTRGWVKHQRSQSFGQKTTERSDIKHVIFHQVLENVNGFGNDAAVCI